MKVKLLGFVLVLIATKYLQAQNPTSYTAQQAGTQSASFNLKNDHGTWHLSGPRSYEQNNNFSIFWHNGTYYRYFTVLTNGNIGIGTQNAVSRLEVNGDISMVRTCKLKFLETVNGDDRAYIRSTFGQNGEDFNSLIFSIGNGNESMIINGSGKVGIGTLSPSAKLEVNGKIISEEIKVQIVNGPDYVPMITTFEV